MKQSVVGSARMLLLAALACAAVVIVVSVALMTTDESSSPTDDEGGPSQIVPGRKTRPSKAKSEDEDETEVEEDPNVFEPIKGESRPPEGNLVIDADTLRAVFRVRHWEETRRQIDDMQREGKPIPDDVIKALIEMLAKEDLRLDAVLVLGGIKDDATGRLLAELATSRDASIETRTAALDAISRSGSKAALPFLQQILADGQADERIVRGAMFAVGGVGGPEATKTLLDLLSRHQNDDLHGVVVMALGKLRDSDGGMASELRAARGAGDRQRFMSVIVATQMQGGTVGPEVKSELQRMVESDAPFEGLSVNDEERLQMKASVLPAAAAAGIVAPVLRQATTPGPMRDVALEALVHARGDSAAKQIAEALKTQTDDVVRWKLAKALGQTASFKATSTLVALLDDSSVNVRNVAAMGLGQIRDATAVPAILKHLETSAPEYEYTCYLVGSLGQIGANAALPTLEKLAASEEAFWRDQIRPFAKSAITRIKTSNPDSLIQDGK